MAVPGEHEHVAYLQYLERWAIGEEAGPKLSKDEWRKRRKQGESEAAKELNGEPEAPSGAEDEDPFALIR